MNLLHHQPRQKSWQQYRNTTSQCLLVPQACPCAPVSSATSRVAARAVVLTNAAVAKALRLPTIPSSRRRKSDTFRFKTTRATLESGYPFLCQSSSLYQVFLLRIGTQRHPIKGSAFHSLINCPWLVIGFQQGRRKLPETGRIFLQRAPSCASVGSGGHR